MQKPRDECLTSYCRCSCLAPTGAARPTRYKHYVWIILGVIQDGICGKLTIVMKTEDRNMIQASYGCGLS